MNGDPSGRWRIWIFSVSSQPFIPPENSLEDRKESLHGQLAHEIKKTLWSGQREDPDKTIDLNVNQDVFMEGLGSVLPGFSSKREDGLPVGVK